MDRILGNPSYEKSCDFTMINTVAQSAFSLPCHLVVNNVSDESTDAVQVEINEELVKSLSDDLVTVTAQSPTVSKYVYYCQCVTTHMNFIAATITHANHS